ncbi:THxN family PEP-CTERM protein [Arsukibacterium perlucidum]|uniref:THxN family PEP-CTERM protein n=1 Tax=Arsukibacterium perlucidum TaxID=368811 RepID=UPI00037E6E5F|nr:THxN family PEP-CTERM protein [Arsukibacterium perlucidum]
MNKLCKGMLAGAALLVAPFTQAAVIEWTYEVSIEWTGADFSTGNGDASWDDTLISWGAAGGNFNSAPNNRSALQISDSPAVGNIFTNDMTPTQTNTITHFNNSISNTFSTLEQASLLATLNLTAINPFVGDPIEFTTTFAIDFIETPNTSPCGFPVDTVCDDIFVIQFGALNTEFVYDGVTYFASIVELSGNLTALPDATCATAGVANGCLGFTTPENTFTPAQFGFFITTRPVNVPEPAMLGLFGLGLLGLRAFGRRRSAKK